MAEPRPPEPALLICGILAGSEGLLDQAAALLGEHLGDVDLVSETYAFAFTDYYEREMGPHLKRRFVAFADLVDPGDLAALKRRTNDLERAVAGAVPRPVNLDPGLLSGSQLVLASTKPHAHRIYLRDGIYAEVTLVYRGGAWVPLPWTYPDFAGPTYRPWLSAARERCLTRLRAKEETRSIPLTPTLSHGGEGDRGGGAAMSPYVLMGGAILAVSLVITAVLVPLVRPISRRVGFVDHPNPRKVHRAPMPLGGGVAIYLGVTATVLGGVAAALALGHGHLPAWLPASLPNYFGGVSHVALKVAVLLGGGTVLMLMGLIDDRRPLPWTLRLGIQMTVAFFVWLFVARITVFVGSHVASAIITVLWITVITNAFNFLDNMDGLSAGVAAIAAGIFLAVAIAAGPGEARFFVAAALLALIGALLGFLLYNFPPARIFMGDAGSNFIGYLLGSLTAMLTFSVQGRGTFCVLAPLVILALPLYDFTSVVLLRLASGHSPFKADKRHFSHRLVALGLTSRQAVLTIYLVTFSLGVSATLLFSVDTAGAVTIFAQVLVMIAVIWILERAAARRAGGEKSE